MVSRYGSSQGSEMLQDMFNQESNRPEFFIGTIEPELDGKAFKVTIELKAYSIQQAENRAVALARTQGGIFQALQPRSFIVVDSEGPIDSKKDVRKKWQVTVANEAWVRKNL